MAGETVKPNLYLPPGFSPAIVAKLIIQILECKRLTCKCETSKEILHFALKILLSEDELSLYSDHKFRTITKFSSYSPTNNVATQTRRRKYVSCTIQTDSESAIPKKSVALQTEKKIDIHNKIKRMSNNSTKTVGTQVDLLEFSSVANKENIFKLPEDACIEKSVENEDDKVLSEKIAKKEKPNKKVSRVTYFHGKKLIEKGSKKSPFIIPLLRDDDADLSDPRLKDRDDRECLKLWNSSSLWNVPQKDEEPEICVKKLIDDDVETTVKEIANIFPLDFNGDEMCSYSSIIKTNNDNYSSNAWDKIHRSGDSPEDSYTKLDEITNIDYGKVEEDSKTDILERQKLDPLRFNRRNICKDPRIKPKNCIYNNNHSVSSVSKSRRVTITEGMPLERIISSDPQKIRHRDECFCNWAPRQACPSDPRIKLRCGNEKLDYRNQKRDTSYSAELPLKKQKLECDSVDNNESYSGKLEIWTPQSATPEFSPASIESAYDSIKIPLENNLICNLEKNLSFRETLSEAASHKISENDEKHDVKDFQQGYLRFNDEKMNHLLKSSNVCDSTEVQHQKLSPERLNSPPVSTLSTASRQKPENLNKNEDAEAKFTNSVENNERFFNETISNEGNNSANTENEENHSILPYKVEFSSNSCKSDIKKKELQNEVAIDSSCDKQTSNRSSSETIDEKCESQSLLQEEYSPKSTNQVSCQKPNTLNCKRDSQDSGISEHNVLDSENMEVYSPTDELSMCSDMEVSYTPPIHPSSPDRSPLLDLDSDKNAADDVEKDAAAMPNNFEKLPEYSTKCMELSTISKPTNGESDASQNYSFMKNWVNCVPQWFQQQSLPNYYKWYRDGSQIPAMHYQTFYPPYSNNYISDWLTCYSWWNGNAAGWH